MVGQHGKRTAYRGHRRRTITRALAYSLSGLIGFALLAPTPATAIDDLVDTRFEPRVLGSQPYVEDAVLLPDGKILVGGAFDCIGSNLVECPPDGIGMRLARLNSDGSLDEAFNARISPGLWWDVGKPDQIGTGRVEHIIVQPDGRILIAGTFNAVAGEPRGPLVRLHADGSLDESFDATPYVQYLSGAIEFANTARIDAIALQEDGKIIIAGQCGLRGLTDDPAGPLVRLNSDGSCDPTFVWPHWEFNQYQDWWHPFLTVYSIAIQGDGSVLMAGEFYSRWGWANEDRLPGLVRLKQDGSFDHDFRPEVGINVREVSVQFDEKILIRGETQDRDGNIRSGVARLDREGKIDTSFHPDLRLSQGKVSVTGVTLTPDRQYLVGGNFDYVDGKRVTGFVRLNSDGSMDPNFKVRMTGVGCGGGVAPNSGPWLHLPQPNGGIVVSASPCVLINGFERDGLARLSSEATLPPPGALVDVSIADFREYAVVRWKAPLGGQQSNVFYYEIRVGKKPWKKLKGLASKTSRATIKRAHKTVTQVKIRAVNEAGPGPSINIEIAARKTISRS